MKRIRKRKPKLALVFLSTIILAVYGCGSTSTSDDEDIRTFYGELETDSTTSSISKAVSANESVCIGEVCEIKAIDPSGIEREGLIYEDGEIHRWEIQLSAGDWRMGFYNSNGELISYLEANGISEFYVTNGNDLNFGKVRVRNGYAFAENDIEGLGENGIRSSLRFREMEENYDTSVFAIYKMIPQDGHLYVSPCRPIKIHLTQAVDINTINEDSFLVMDENEEIIEGTLSYGSEVEFESGEIENEYEIKFIPTDGFVLGSTITVSVLSGEDGLLNEDGVPLDKDYIWSFAIRDFGGAGGECYDVDEEFKRERERVRERSGNGN